MFSGDRGDATNAQWFVPDIPTAGVVFVRCEILSLDFENANYGTLQTRTKRSLDVYSGPVSSFIRILRLKESELSQRGRAVQGPVSDSFQL